MRIVTVLLATSIIATAPLSSALAGSRTVAVNACKAAVTEKVEGENIKLSLNEVDPVGKDRKFGFRVRYTNEAGERIATNAECVATRTGEILSLELV